jgi:hypothetical protein
MFGMVATADGMTLLTDETTPPDGGHDIVVKIGYHDRVVFRTTVHSYSSTMKDYTFDASGIRGPGTLAATPTGYLGYTPVYLPNGHEGDHFDRISADGKTIDHFEWQCGHSFSQHLGISGKTVAAGCGADTYPIPGIAINSTPIVMTNLMGPGTLLPIGTSGSFWVSYLGVVQKMMISAPSGTALWGGITQMDPTARFTADTATTGAFLAFFDGDILMGWIEAPPPNATGDDKSGTFYLGRLDSGTGAVKLTEKISATPQFQSLDNWVNYPGGDVGWLKPHGASWPSLIRARACR